MSCHKSQERSLSLRRRWSARNTTRNPLALTGGCQSGGRWGPLGLIQEAREALLWQLLRKGKREHSHSVPCQGLSPAHCLSVSLIFSIVFLFSISLVPALIFITYFLLFAFGLYYSSCSRFLMQKPGFLILEFSYFLTCIQYYTFFFKHCFFCILQTSINYIFKVM